MPRHQEVVTVRRTAQRVMFIMRLRWPCQVGVVHFMLRVFCAAGKLGWSCETPEGICLVLNGEMTSEGGCKSMRRCVRRKLLQSPMPWVQVKTEDAIRNNCTERYSTRPTLAPLCY